MKEIALFYEDFLTEKDADGHYIYRLAISPEVRSETRTCLCQTIQPSYIAIAKELLTNLICSL